MAHAYAAQDVETDSDPWSFVLRNGIICRAEVLKPDWEAGWGWSLARFYSQKDAEEDVELTKRLDEVLVARGIKRAYAPSVAFRPAPDQPPIHSVDIVQREDLTTRITLPSGAQVLRNKDLPGGGVPIRRGEAFIMSGAGCPPLILAGKGFCVAMHGSRDTLIDREHLDGKPPRAHPSIIHASVDFLNRNYGVKPGKMSFKGGLHIPPWNFVHSVEDPDWGDRNRMLYEHIMFTYGPEIMDDNGELDLASLALAICDKLSVAGTFGTPLPKRASTTRDEQKGELRNLVLVYRVQ